MSNEHPPTNGTAKSTNRLTTVLILLQSVATLLMLWLVYTTTFSKPPQLFQAIVPQKVLSPEVSLSDGFVRIESTKCNLTNSDLAVGNVTYWIRDEPTYLRLTSAELSVDKGISFPPGCATRIFENAFPQGITEGLWHIQGSNLVRDEHGNQQNVVWHTEKFIIREPEEIK